MSGRSGGDSGSRVKYVIQNESQEEDEETQDGITFWLVCSVLACTVGSSLQFGYNTGVVNAPEQVLEDFMNVTSHQEWGIQASITLLWSVTVAIFAVGGMIGGVSAGYFGNKFGRKGSMLLNNILAIVGVGLMVFCKMAKSIEMLIIGRFVMGINCGISTGVAPLYLSEIAPLHLRGASGTIHQLAITFGIAISQILGLDRLLGNATQFPFLFGVAIVPVVVQLILLPLCPESPRHLYITKLDRQGAETALQKLRNTLHVQNELQELSHECDSARNKPKVTIPHLFTNPSLRQPLFICIMIQLAQQLSGINAVIYYSTSIFKDALDGNEQVAKYATIGMGVINFLMTFVSAGIVDRAGRRTLLLYGVAGMWAFSLLLTVGLVWQDNGWGWASYISIASVVLYVVSFAIGPGSIPWFIVAELFEQGPRSAAISISVLVNWAANCTVGLVFPAMQKGLGNYNFIPFSVLLTIFWIYIYARVPETKGKSVEEISEEFKEAKVYYRYESVPADAND